MAIQRRCWLFTVNLFKLYTDYLCYVAIILSKTMNQVVVLSSLNTDSKKKAQSLKTSAQSESESESAFSAFRHSSLYIRCLQIYCRSSYL